MAAFEIALLYIVHEQMSKLPQESHRMRGVGSGRHMSLHTASPVPVYSSPGQSALPVSPAAGRNGDRFRDRFCCGSWA